MKLALVTCNHYPDLAESDKPLIPLFAAQEIIAEPAIWNDAAINWSAYNAVLIRSPWDYHLHLDAFNAWLNMLETQNIYVLNPVNTLKWNLHKFYLKELQQKGIEIIPTIFINRSQPLDLLMARAKGWQKAVIKPAVSGGAYLTHVFDLDKPESIKKELELLAEHGDMLLQPFMPEIIEQGEISMLFFNRQYSHSVLKLPAPEDFRVQLQHGGITSPFAPDSYIIEEAHKILQILDGELLYARVDGIIVNGKFMLMELELLEPFLFFDYKAGTIKKFVAEAAGLIRDKK